MAIQAETLLRDWTTSSPRIQADEEVNDVNPNSCHSNGSRTSRSTSSSSGGIPVATFISNLILNHASEIGSRFTPKKHRHDNDDRDDLDAHHPSAPVMDGGEFHVVNGELIQVLNGNDNGNDNSNGNGNTHSSSYEDYDETRRSHRRDRSRHFSPPSSLSSYPSSCMPNEPIRQAKKWMKNRRDKSGRHSRPSQGSHHRLRKGGGGSSRASRKQQCQDCRTDFSIKSAHKGGKRGRKSRSKSHRVVVPDPYTGTNTYRPHHDGLTTQQEEWYQQQQQHQQQQHPHPHYIYELSAPSHQHMTRTATAYPVYDLELIADATTTATIAPSPTVNPTVPSSPHPPSNSRSTPVHLFQESWDKLNQLPSSCLPRSAKTEADLPTTPNKPSMETALSTTIAASSSFSLEQPPDTDDLTFEHFLQDQEAILKSSKEEEEWTSVSLPFDVDEEEPSMEGSPVFESLECLESSSSSIMEEQIHAVNVQSMIHTFEAQTSKEHAFVPPPPQLFQVNHDTVEEQRDEVSMAPSPCLEPAQQGLPLPSSPKDSCNNELKILFVGSPQSGKTSLVKSLTGSEDDTKPAGRCRPRRGANATASTSMLDKQRQKLQQKGLNVSFTGDEKVLVSVNVKSWTPTSTTEHGRNIRFSLWDLPGSSLESGLHPSTQKLYFTPNSLYVVVWDMSAKNNPFSYDEDIYSSCDEEEFSEYEYEDDDEFWEEYELRQEEAINHDIDENVLFWIDTISKQFAQGCAILPVVTHRDKFDNAQVERRTNLLKKRLNKMAASANIVFDARGQIPRVSCLGDQGASELHNAILDVTSNFPLVEGHVLKRHLETRIPPVTAIVQKVITQLKAKGHTIEHIYDIHQKVATEFGLNAPQSVEVFGLPEIIDALKFLSSTGSVMYFGRDEGNTVENDILSQAVILDPRWITSALSCILRTDLRRKLKQLKQDRDISCSKKEELVEYHEAFQKKTSECAVVSREDTALLWDSRSFMKKARETFHSNHDFALYHYLRKICERHGVFVPLTISPTENSPTFYLLPSLFKKVPEDYWSYRPLHNHKVTLCQSWVFNDGRVPSGLIDMVNVSVLKGLFYKHSSRSDEYSYRAKVDEIRCWKTAFSARIVEFFSEQNSPRKSTNIITIYVRIVDKGSVQCVDSNDMMFGDKKLIVSATGNAGNEGGTIWNLGYGEAIESVKGVIEENFADASSIEREVVCPDCLRCREPRNVCTYCHDSLSLDHFEPAICSHGHRLNASLLLGPRNEVLDDSSSVSTSGISSIASMNSMFDGGPVIENVSEVLGSVVLIGLWDRDAQEIKGLGSGFIADGTRGFVVTASHIFYDNQVGKPVGPVYYGLKNAKAVVGVIPKSGLDDENVGAIFTYCADIIVDDVNKTDACILRITSKFRSPVKADGIKLNVQPETIISQKSLIREGLQPLRCKGCHLDEHVRVLGFNQEGEGLMGRGEHVERMPCVTKGYVSKKLSNHTSLRNLGVFMPNSEIVVICNTISGHSGGPCVNSSGEVIGIVSRADPVQKDRCYLVPSKQINILLHKAKERFEIGGNHELMNLFNMLNKK